MWWTSASAVPSQSHSARRGADRWSSPPGRAALTQGRCDRTGRARSRPGAHGNRHADRRDITELTLALAERGVRSSVPRLPTVHGDGENEFLKAIASIARDNGVSGLPCARHPGTQHAHPRLADWQPIRPG